MERGHGCASGPEFGGNQGQSKFHGAAGRTAWDVRLARAGKMERRRRGAGGPGVARRGVKSRRGTGIHPAPCAYLQQGPSRAAGGRWQRAGKELAELAQLAQLVGAR